MNAPRPFDPRTEAHLLSAYVDGELDAEAAARIEAHLALPEAESGAARREIAELRRLKSLAGRLRLKEPPPEEWEAFWESVYNRGERSLGWLMLLAGAAVVGGWLVLQAVQSLLAKNDLPTVVKGGIFILSAGLVILLVSVVRERLHTRARTRYKDVIR